jgi:hypothetical protein
MDLRIIFKVVSWIELIQDMAQYYAFLEKVMNVRVPYMQLISWSA